ncbi:putative apical endosomal glycoprotein [Triplophysa rosa]|uniref:Apical endosomal glycoprotein n=1 Tax=Triplophysa rosa TaxID=992332 RepID=A0A9W7TCA3_TRIRA|nr:putative apical endosomal glycoprotein [Triplophysa rosa]
MEPGVLIFLLYLMIAHELVCGLMQYRRQAAKPHKRLMWRSSARVCRGTWRVSSQPVHTRRRVKYGRIVRKV